MRREWGAGPRFSRSGAAWKGPVPDTRRPAGIVLLDQGERPGPQPALDALFPQDRLIDVVVGLVPDQTVGAMLAAIAVNLAVLVLIDAADQVVGHPRRRKAEIGDGAGIF